MSKPCHQHLDSLAERLREEAAKLLVRRKSGFTILNATTGKVYRDDEPTLLVTVRLDTLPTDVVRMLNEQESAAKAFIEASGFTLTELPVPPRKPIDRRGRKFKQADPQPAPTYADPA